MIKDLAAKIRCETEQYGTPYLQVKNGVERKCAETSLSADLRGLMWVIEPTLLSRKVCRVDVTKIDWVIDINLR